MFTTLANEQHLQQTVKSYTKAFTTDYNAENISLTGYFHSQGGNRC